MFLAQLPQELAFCSVVSILVEHGHIHRQAWFQEKTTWKLFSQNSEKTLEDSLEWVVKEQQSKSLRPSMETEKKRQKTKSVLLRNQIFEVTCISNTAPLWVIHNLPVLCMCIRGDNYFSFHLYLSQFNYPEKILNYLKFLTGN